MIEGRAVESVGSIDEDYGLMRRDVLTLHGEDDGLNFEDGDNELPNGNPLVRNLLGGDNEDNSIADNGIVARTVRLLLHDHKKVNVATSVSYIAASILSLLSNTIHIQ